MSELHWQVLYVRPRCEKKMAAYCVAQSIDYYLPLRNETKIYQRRKVQVEKPVFPGYVFVGHTEEQRVIMLKSNLIVRLLEVDAQKVLLHELEQIRRALQVDPTLGACAAFTEGVAVRIIAGAFRGIEGVVHAVRGETKVVLNVEMIGQAVAVEVETDYLEAMD